MPRLTKKAASLGLAVVIDDPAFARNLKVEMRSAVRNPRLLEALTDVTVAAAQEGQKFKHGRKIGTLGPWRKRIAAMLKRDPALKNQALWEALKAAPPRGWTHIESSQFGERFEGPTGGHEFKPATFRTYASEERQKLKG